ncbi:hypothetical protein C8R45DRAFT_1172672 [Mycena sanguinolenta]|nr:hypothetical protein C8R45DRAFT_1172672 [Mycena sanguinolenta]
MLITSETFSLRAIIREQTERTRHSPKADIKRLIEQSESKITSLDSQINLLVKLRDQERACVAALRHIISPVHILPVELLVEIFLLAIRDDTHLRDVQRISQVCADWRNLAHGTPRLWTLPLSIRLDYKDEQAQVHVDGLKAWLARSAPLPIPVSIESSPTINHCILEEVLRTAPRWCSLTLSGLVPVSLVTRLAGCRLDSVEEFVATRFATSSPVATSFTNIPRLRKLTLAMDTVVLFQMPWSQLTDLTLFCDSPLIALDVLAQSSGELHLQHLSLPVLGSAGDVTPFFDYLSAPALEELELDFADLLPVDECWPDSSRFTTFLLRSANITHLELSELANSSLTSDDILLALRCTANLTHLHLELIEPSADHFDNILISALTYHDGVIPLVPRLHHFVLQTTDEMTFIEDILIEMVTSRWWMDTEVTSDSTPPAVARWTNVELWSYLSGHFVDIMTLLQHQGLPVKIFTF